MSDEKKRKGRFGNFRDKFTQQVEKAAKQAQETAKNVAQSEEAQRLIRIAEEQSQQVAETANRVGNSINERIKSAVAQIDMTELDKNFTKYRSMLQAQKYDGKPTVLVVGRTGAGKSTLINKIIGADVAPVGAGEPITQEFALYSSDALPIELYDSPGWEGGEEKAKMFLSKTRSLLQENSGQIQLIWYVIDAQSTRLVDFEIDLLNNIFKDKPVCLLLTKCDIASDEQIIGILRAIIESRFPSQIGAYEIAADPIEDLDPELQERFDYRQVLDKSYYVLDIEG